MLGLLLFLGMVTLASGQNAPNPISDVNQRPASMELKFKEDRKLELVPPVLIFTAICIGSALLCMAVFFRYQLCCGQNRNECQHCHGKDSCTC
ncbi:unnamed protein product, partial [Mesorhabditis spiculigera]